MKIRLTMTLLSTLILAGCSTPPPPPVISSDTLVTSEVNGVKLQHRMAIAAPKQFKPIDKEYRSLYAASVMAAEWYRQLGHTLLNGVRNGFSAEQIDHSLLKIPALPTPPAESESEILSIIGFRHPDLPGLGWQQAADCFDPAQYTSFWWTNQCDGHPLYTHVHSGNLTVQLFSLLFEPNGWARPGRGGQYPQMFD